MKEILTALEEHGLLLKQDAVLPSVTTLIAGRPIKGSWWGAPESHEIFDTLEALTDHEDVTFVKLVAGKDTLVHRRVWAALLGAADGPFDWQVEGLSSAATKLFEQVESDGECLTTGATAKELETRLLVAGAQVHTDEGKHAKALWSWKTWRKNVGFSGRKIGAKAARLEIEALVMALSDGRRPKLPWPWSSSGGRS